MSDGNDFRVALDNGLLKAICQILNLRFISGLNASFVAALEKVQLDTLHDDTDVRRSLGIRIIIKEPEDCPLTRVGTVAVVQPVILRLMSSRVMELHLRDRSAISDLQ